MSFKNTALIMLSAMGSLLSEAFGGWDVFLKALIMFMVADYITGMTVALVFHRSGKTKTGGASSEVGFKGIVKKGCIFFLIAIAVKIDSVTGTNHIRSATIFFFMGNEGLSVIENIGLMGVKYPAFLKKALEVIKEKEE